MSDNQEEILRLRAQLERLVRTQIDFQREVSYIRSELERLTTASSARERLPLTPDAPPPRPPATAPGAQRPPEPPVTARVPPEWQTYTPPPKTQAPPPRQAPPASAPTFGYGTSERGGEKASGDRGVSSFVDDYFASARENLEKFIGENLISKIGIIILVLGVGIGAKYAMDNGWISETMRIAFAYAAGIMLIAVAARLKAKYQSFSALLLSGGMAIMYFVTYFAYSQYALFGQPVAFVLMGVFTVLTVVAALVYNRQVIAHIGLVGAYAVPFLLSNNSGNYPFLFAYMAIVNSGILAISVRKLWTPIFYTSSGFTWLIFGGWLAAKYAGGEHFYLALIALAAFFTIFYATKIVHGVVHHQSSDTENIASIIVTVALFYIFAFKIGDVAVGMSEYTVFFSYLAIFALVTLLTSYRFYGRILVYIACPFTWLIFGTWFSNRYVAEEHFVFAAVFASVFFSIYYFATLIYRLVTNDIGLIENMGFVLTNSFIFYGFGYAIIDSRPELQWIEGIYTAGHAFLHSIVARAVNRFKPTAVDVVQVLAVLIVTFATITIPVQFDGNRVTLIWAVEGAALYWFGRSRQIRMFEYFSYPVMALGTISLFVDWVNLYSQRSMQVSPLNRQPLLNGDFITALVFLGAFAAIYFTNRKTSKPSVLGDETTRIFGFIVGGLWLFVLYNALRIEIGNYFHLLLVDNAQPVREYTTPDFVRVPQSDLRSFNAMAQIDYTMLFFSILGAVNLIRIRSKALAIIAVNLSVASLAIFATVGMFLLYTLRVSYLDLGFGFDREPMYVLVRYISAAFAAILLIVLYRTSRAKMLSDVVSPGLLRVGFDAILYPTIFIVASCELVSLMSQFRIPDSNKLGLSILWGIYALAMVVIGIAFDKVHLRIAAIVLLAVTLIKLFFYDIADLPTIPKTILFITIGLLLLIVSFLYTKYKAFMFKAAPEHVTGGGGPQTDTGGEPKETLN